MRRFWSVLFLLVPILGVATFVAAPYYNIWFPKDVSEHGRTIDNLFMFILWLTGIVFVATELTLFYFMWKYDEKSTKTPVKFSHGSHALELVWTILPAATLLFIAIYQMEAWASAKMQPPDMKPLVEVTGRQFNWDFRYPGPDNELYTEDDIVRTDGKLYLPVNEDVLLRITSLDVLHSFFLPNLRMKQDVIPGMQQSMWFKATDTGGYDIVCAELCGWGHYKMKGRVYFLPREKYEMKLEEMRREQNTMRAEIPEEDDE
ncbi:MAG: cytochrome c oxidase subunit II [Planctomycetota bacterium]